LKESLGSWFESIEQNIAGKQLDIEQMAGKRLDIEQISAKRLEDPQNVADGFNNYFGNVGSSLANQIGNTNVCVSDSLPSSNPHSAFFEDTDSRQYLQEKAGHN